MKYFAKTHLNHAQSKSYLEFFLRRFISILNLATLGLANMAVAMSIFNGFPNIFLIEKRLCLKKNEWEGVENLRIYGAINDFASINSKARRPLENPHRKSFDEPLVTQP